MKEETTPEQAMGTLTIKLSKKAIETDIHKLILICM